MIWVLFTRFFVAVAPLALALLLSVAWPSKGMAMAVPWGKQPVQLAAENEDLDQFLLRLFTRIRIPMVASESVTGKVTGRFNNRPDVLFRELVDSYGLTWYFDGTVIYVYALTETQSRLLELEPSSASRFKRLIDDLMIADSRFPVQVAELDGFVSVSGPPRYVEKVASIAEFLQGILTRTGRPQAVRVYRLSHATAADRTVVVAGRESVIPGVATLLQSLAAPLLPSGKAPPPNRSLGQSSQRELPASGRGLLGQGLASVGKPGEQEAAQTASPASSDASGSDVADPGPTIRADTRLNAVVVRDALERIDAYDALIRSLDLPSPLVEIEATVVDVSNESSDSLGLDWSLLLSNRAENLSGPVLGFDGAPADAPLTSILLGSRRSVFFAQLNALKESGQASVESRPRVVTLDNLEAVLSTSQEFFVRVAGRDAADLFNVNVGLTLRVTPSVVVENGTTRVRMQVSIEDGSIGAASVDGVPVVSRSAISASVTVGEGDSLLIGGLTSERSSDGLRGVPGLVEVPYFGRLFGTRSKEVSKSQRMFLLTPRLVKGAS